MSDLTLISGADDPTPCSATPKRLPATAWAATSATPHDHVNLGSSPPALSRKGRPLLRSYSEMSIESGMVDGELLQADRQSMRGKESIREEPSRPSSLAEKVKSIFELATHESLVAEFPCYLVRLVTLPGWMYITESHVCFYASLPEREQKSSRLSGYLSKKNHRASPRVYRYYFDLRNHVLSWYESAEQKYHPVGNIDLKSVTHIRATKSKKFGIKITSTGHRCTLWADSEVSQKEWMDELRREVFMAKNSGNSVRIVLPFSKMSQVAKSSAFEFAEYIRVSLVDTDESVNDQTDDYFFAFFPDIEEAYKKISTRWREASGNGRESSQPSLNSCPTSPDAMQGVDPFMANTSSAVSAILVGTLTNPLSVFRNVTVDTTVQRPKSSDDDTSHASSHGLSLLEKLPRIARKSDDRKVKRRSTVSVQSTGTTFPSPTLTKDNESVEKAEACKNAPGKWATFAQLSDVESTEDLPSLQISNNDLATSQIDNTKDTSVSEAQENAMQLAVPKPTRRFRSGSLNSIRNFALLPFHRTSDDTLIDDDKKSSRMGSLGSLIRRDRSHSRSSKDEGTVVSFTPDARSKNSSSWISARFMDMFQKEYGLGIWSTAPIDANSSREEEAQQTMDEQLKRHFPMLGDTETVEAVFSTAFWRLLPYYGKLYVTQNYFCFHSKVLAGRQKLVVPMSDIDDLRRLKSREYYLLHGIGITVKDLQDEIYFEFSSVDLRNRCYAMFFLHTTAQREAQRDLNSQEPSECQAPAKPLSLQLFEILGEATDDHVVPPTEYNGPPLLSSADLELRPKYEAPTKSMHITCLTIGSRGDVQPYIALCKQLQQDGHRCRIASHEEYKDWVESHGIEFRSIGGDPGELMKLCIDNGFLSVSFIKTGVKFFYHWLETLLETAWDACQGTDLLIESPSAMVGIHMAEKLQIPYFRSMPFPWTRTTRFPHPFAMQNYTRGRVYNDMTYVMIDMALWTGTSKYINRFRKEKLHLPATTLERLEIFKVPHIYSFSPAVLAPPKDWPDYVHCTGYWFLDNPDQKWQPDDALMEFLHAKDDSRPIVYIGFGSIIVANPDETSQTIIQAVLQAQVRAIICKGWSSRMAKEQGDDQDAESRKMLDRHPGTIYGLDSVPHDWLFPQIQGAVHHGGAGTTAAGLRAGLPTVIKPFFGDQRFWGQRVEELGVGVCIPKLTMERLSEALTTITRNTTLINKAKLVGETIRQENGVKTAIECIYRDIPHARRGDPRKSMDIEGNSRPFPLPSWWTSWSQGPDEHDSEDEHE